MPFSGQSKYPVGDKVTSRWSLVKKALSQELLCVEDLEEAILSYNPRFKKSWSFRLLKAFFIEEATLEERVTFFDETLPKMQEICLSAEKYFPEPPRLLKKRSNREIYLSQHQASILMIMAFFCLYPRRNSSRADAEYGAYNFINFNKLFGLPTSNHSNFEKLRTLLNYFHRVSKSPPTGVVSFHRVEADFMPLWDMEEKKLTRVKFDDDGLIDQEGSKYIEMDFANKYIGGGVLGHGLVQEEIRFIVAPEFIVTLLLTEELSDDECLVMTGCERYSDSTGYASSYLFASDHRDTTERDELYRRKTQVVAMDAIPYYNGPSDQYLMSNITRDLNKAYVSFSSPKAGFSFIIALS